MTDTSAVLPPCPTPQLHSRDTSATSIPSRLDHGLPHQPLGTGSFEYSHDGVNTWVASNHTTPSHHKTPTEHTVLHDPPSDVEVKPPPGFTPDRYFPPALPTVLAAFQTHHRPPQGTTCKHDAPTYSTAGALGKLSATKLGKRGHTTTQEEEHHHRIRKRIHSTSRTLKH